MKKQASREQKFFNRSRRIFQWIVTHIGYQAFLKLIYRLEVQGKENIPKDNAYIVAPNHLSLLDPPMVASVLNKPVAFMAKQELFKNPILRWWLNWLGAFAVDRDNLSVSTIRTVLTIKKTEWVFGIFPQGTRRQDGKLGDFTKGFASMAKKMDADILPVGIMLKENPNSKKKDIQFRVGEPISCKLTVDEIAENWAKAVSELAELEHIKAN